MTNSSRKIVAAVVGLGLALSVFAGVSTASAQAMSLTDLVNLFISLGIISPDKAAAAKAAVTSSASVSFTRDLTVGSSGADVTALQNMLGVSPATGYFGSITKAAVQQYQASKGIASTGYFGPLTRAAANQSAPAVPGTTVPGTTPIVNSGVEGTLTASKTSISNSTVREGETMKTVLAFKVEAKLSDINVQRVKLDLGTSTTIYTKIFRTMYLTDASGRVLAQADLNSNTVVKDTIGNDTAYALTLGGFSYNVPRNTTQTLYVKADVYSSIKEADQYTRTIRLFDNGVRGVDGAGIDQYAGSTSISQNLGVGVTVAESATIKLTLNSSNFKAADVVAASGADEDELDMLNVLAFDLKAEKDEMLVTEIKATIAKTGTGSATATRVHLYEGSAPIASEDVNTSTGVVTFDDLEITIAKDSTRTFTLKTDIINANGTAAVMTASVTGGNIVAENSLGTEKTASGSATGEAFTVRNVGPVFALTSKSISTSGSNQSGSTLSTSTVQGRFVVDVTAVGGDILFGTQASTSPMFVFKTYNSAGAEVVYYTASTTGFTVPDGVTTSDASFSLTEGQTKTITVTLDLPGKAANGNPITATAIAIDRINWVANGAAQTSTFMTGKNDWRTNTQNP